LKRSKLLVVQPEGKHVLSSHFLILLRIFVSL
jgi:hypothetical protein